MTEIYINELQNIVKEIMHSGYEVAMMGDPFKGEEENRKMQEEKYAEVLNKSVDEFMNLINDKKPERGLRLPVGDELHALKTASMKYLDTEQRMIFAKFLLSRS